MFNAAMVLLDQGLSVVPSSPIDKRPKVAWKQFQNRLPTHEEWEQWHDQLGDNYNIGIVTGALSGVVVVDCDSENSAEWALRNLPPTTIYSRTGRGYHIWFKHPGVKVKTKAFVREGIDVRGDGGFIVVPPSWHAGSGRNYQWNTGIDCQPYNDQLWNELETYPIKSSPWSETVDEPTGNLNINLADIDISDRPFVHLEKKPVPHGRRNQEAVKYAGKFAALRIDRKQAAADLMEWNLEYCQPPMGERELRSVISSAYKMKHQQDVREGYFVDPMIINDFGMDVNKTEIWVPADQDTVDIVPPFISEPGGAIQEIMEEIGRCSFVSHPIYECAAAIALLGSLAGFKVVTETRSHTNIYIAALGYSGTGKNGGVSVIPKTLRAIDRSNLYGGSTFTSDTALLNMLKKYPIKISVVDEFGDFMKALKVAGSHKSTIPTILKTIYSDPEMGYQKNTADDLKSYDLPYAHFSVYGATVPQTFWESVYSQDSEDGFLSRFLVFESHHKKDEQPKRGVSTPSAQFISAMKALADVPLIYPEASGDIDLSKNLVPPIPVVVPRDQHADELYREYYVSCVRKQNLAFDTSQAKAALYSRSAEYADKLALIHHCSRMRHNMGKGHITHQDMKWAIDIAEWCLNSFMVQVDQRMAASPFQKECKEMMAIIRRSITSKKKMLASRDISRLCGQWNKQRRAQIIEQLLEEEEIVLIKEETGGRPKLFYAIPKGENR